MPDTLKLRGSEVPLTAANTVGTGTYIRIYNKDTADLLLTQANTGGTIGTLTVGTKQTIFIRKSASDTLAGGANLVAVSITA